MSESRFGCTGGNILPNRGVLTLNDIAKQITKDIEEAEDPTLLAFHIAIGQAFIKHYGEPGAKG